MKTQWKLCLAVQLSTEAIQTTWWFTIQLGCLLHYISYTAFAVLRLRSTLAKGLCVHVRMGIMVLHSHSPMHHIPNLSEHMKALWNNACHVLYGILPLTYPMEQLLYIYVSFFLSPTLL